MEDLRNDLAAAEGEESLAFATAITEEASALEAETEKFLDEALISDFQETPLTTLESVIEERQQANERRDRVQSRAKELLELEIAKEKHEKEVKDLEDAISATAQPAAPSGAAGKKKKEAAAAAAPAAESSSAADDFLLKTSMPFKLESADRKDLNPYVLNLTEFLPEVETTRKARDLRAENELLKACLKNAKGPNAFQDYLRRSSHTTL